MKDHIEQSFIHLTYRGNKIEIPLRDDTTVGQLKANIMEHNGDSSLQQSDLKLLFKGKQLTNDEGNLNHIITKPQRVYRLVATGVSASQAQAMDEELRNGMQQKANFVRDDLSTAGQQEMERRKRLGQMMLHQAGYKQQHQSVSSLSSSYSFGRIEILPNLPHPEQAKGILTTLANDPGILACMSKHKWNVGSLAELYPDGKVGESAVCVMGLNENKGQRILLRLRTDDLQGWRKVLSIRKVLYHELAHNVHSDHDSDFFALMRQIERECTELDWTGGQGLSSLQLTGQSSIGSTLYTGGTHRLGGDAETSAASETTTGTVPLRELAARAALSRMTIEEEEIEQNCGCGKVDLFLP
jgi:hypothetical protein